MTTPTCSRWSATSAGPDGVGLAPIAMRPRSQAGSGVRDRTATAGSTRAGPAAGAFDDLTRAISSRGTNQPRGLQVLALVHSCGWGHSPNEQLAKELGPRPGHAQRMTTALRGGGGPAEKPRG